MQLTIQLPDIYFVNSQPKKVAEQVRLYTALMMYRSGQVSAGAVCEIAEIDRYTFLSECKKNRIATIDYSVDELNEELGSYKKSKN